MQLIANILVAFVVVGIYAEEPDRLVNGIPTTIQRFPHAVSLRLNNNHFCGGSIISEHHILTAAHCVEPVYYNPSLKSRFTVVSGTTWLNKGGDYHNVESVYYHKYYDASGERSGWDIGLIKLTKPIKFNDNQKAIKLPTSDVKRAEPVTLAAWGSEGFGKDVHNNLQMLYARSMLYDECQRYHGSFVPIHYNEFCILIAKGIGACQGDSGSGVIRNSDDTIIGLVSSGRPCATGYPDIYTNVYIYLDWIREKMTL